MSFETIITIALALIGVVGTPFVYIWRALVARIDKLEHQQDTMMSRDEVKELINDKLDPIQQDIMEIKDLLKSLIEIRFKSSDSK